MAEEVEFFETEDVEETENVEQNEYVDVGFADMSDGAEQAVQHTSLYSVEDIALLDFGSITRVDVPKYIFGDVSIAFEFYNKFARLNGFSVRKSKVRRNKEGAVIQQLFVCYRQGRRHPKYYDMQNRVRKSKADTRCGCLAKMRVDVDIPSGKWFVSNFSDAHNHDRVGENLVGMLRSHKKLTVEDIGQINNMRRAGISIPHIFASLANQSGGYPNVGFRIQDIYNQVCKENRMLMGDARAAIKFLNDLKRTDPTMFFSHVLDDGGMLKHLFWCDGISQLDYQLFGDVLAFDATYRKNKYHCPLVVFSGVNHHDKSIIFAAALVADETEETYVWVLERLLEAMNGKAPVSVITDGDLAMRNAIRRVFPDAHHRLCAWHLLRNATSNVSNPRFTTLFKKCMLGDYEVGEFTRRWDAMVEELGLQNHEWVNELYDKRNMWSSAHMRGMFFAGFRTTSRCEGLHALLGRFVLSRHNLLDFVQHFQRCLSHLRFKESEADFKSIHGDAVLQTPYPELERFASNLYTQFIMLMALRTTWLQQDIQNMSTWSLPPSFSADVFSGDSLEDLIDKYGKAWMKPCADLKFIYVPINEKHVHWYLMVVDLENKIIYQLDSYLPFEMRTPRRDAIKIVSEILAQILQSEDYTKVMRKEKLSLGGWQIKEASGIQNCGQSYNSAVWVVDWIAMADGFQDNVEGEMKEDIVRLWSTVQVLTGPHNEYAAIVQNKAHEHWMNYESTDNAKKIT